MTAAAWALPQLDPHPERREPKERRLDGVERALPAAPGALAAAIGLRRAARLLREAAALEGKIAAPDEAALEQRVIRSPVNGAVTHRNLGPGEHVHEDNSIPSVARLDPPPVETFLALRRCRRLRPGSRAIMRPDPPLGASTGPGSA